MALNSMSGLVPGLPVVSVAAAGMAVVPISLPRIRV